MRVFGFEFHCDRAAESVLIDSKHSGIVNSIVRRVLPENLFQTTEALIASGSNGGSDSDEGVVRIARAETLSGGCIHDANLLELHDGRKYFMKSGVAAAHMFAQEANGLRAIAATNTLRVPRVVAVGALDDRRSALILEFLERNQSDGRFFEALGRGLASMHRVSLQPHCGWDSDNFLGSSLQHNENPKRQATGQQVGQQSAQRLGWCEFFAECRLTPQLQLAQAKMKPGNSPEFQVLCRLSTRLIDRLDRYIAEPPLGCSLVHGDLWSGNMMAGVLGTPYVFDPAVYNGHREIEFAMPRLFGGFSPEFYGGYNDVWPLDEGWQTRVELYTLYHLLNHLNLFGVQYLDACLSVVRKFA